MFPPSYVFYLWISQRELWRNIFLFFWWLLESTSFDFIVWNPLFLREVGEGGEWITVISIRGRVESTKLKKGWKYGAGAGQLKKGAGIFPIRFFQVLSLFTRKIILLFAKLCYTFEDKFFFFPPKLNLFVCVRKVGVLNETGGGLSAWGWVNCLKDLKMEWNKKNVGKTKI